jgi:membrane fusion protein, multidrug efflux system
MEPMNETFDRKRWGRGLGIGFFVAAVVVLLLVILETDYHPRTDDASVRANFIQIAPEVSGRLVELPVRDNMLVKKGTLLFVIDPRPYEYALQQALADQAILEEQIIDEKRKIAAQHNAEDAARAGLHISRTGIKTALSNIEMAKAAVTRAQAAASAAEAQLKYATNDRDRIEPLLKKKYVTVDQVDQANTAVRVAQGNYDAALASLSQTQAQYGAAVLQQEQADAAAVESASKLGQAGHDVDRIETLIAQRPAKAAKVLSARLDLEYCRVVAPFDAYVTNMNISEGAYARPGSPMFTLIDTRNWWIVANYRESKLKAIRAGSHVDVYLMGHPDRKFTGVVESIGFGVFPEDGAVSNGLPNIERTLNWVHLSTRFPVRVHVQDPDPTLFRMGETAVTVVR